MTSRTILAALSQEYFSACKNPFCMRLFLSVGDASKFAIASVISSIFSGWTK